MMEQVSPPAGAELPDGGAGLAGEGCSMGVKGSFAGDSPARLGGKAPGGRILVPDHDATGTAEPCSVKRSINFVKNCGSNSLSISLFMIRMVSNVELLFR